jgi:hypothetical protein
MRTGTALNADFRGPLRTHIFRIKSLISRAISRVIAMDL